MIKELSKKKRLDVLEEVYSEMLKKRSKTAEAHLSRDTRENLSETETAPQSEFMQYKAVFATRLTETLLDSWKGEIRTRLPAHDEPYNLFELIETVRQYIVSIDPYNVQINAEIIKPRGRTETYATYMTRFMFYFDIIHGPKKEDWIHGYYLAKYVLEAHAKNFSNELEAYTEKIVREMPEEASVEKLLMLLSKYAPREKQAYSKKRSNLDYKKSNKIKKNRRDWYDY